MGNQVWHNRDGQLAFQTPKGDQGYCIDIAYKRTQLPTGEASWRTCTPKAGQLLKRHDVRDGTFLLRSPDSLQCLIAEVSRRQLRMGPCDEQQRWRSLEDRQQVQHAQSGQCIDAHNEATPLLYPCHESTGRKQRIRIVDDPGWVQFQGGWEDNGRRRWFEKCLDFQPQDDIPVSLQPCDTAKRRNVRWTRIGIRTPPETEIWRTAEKPPPDYPVLGGDAEPP